jgi:hypothetical protein
MLVRRVSTFVLALSALVPGCVHNGRDIEAEGPLRQRAQFDLSCKELSITPLGEDEIGTFGSRKYAARGVEGCGRKATYLKPGGNLGDWVKDSETTAKQ